jgi:class 3 adenylate cyclase
MGAATEGRADVGNTPSGPPPGNTSGLKLLPPSRWGGGRPLVRNLILWVGIAAAYVTGLSFMKSRMLDQLAHESLASIGPRHSKVLSLFQASYYFFYEEQFLPGIRQIMTQNPPPIRRVVVLSSTSSVLFDSDLPPKSAPAGSGETNAPARAYGDPEIVTAVTASSATAPAAPSIHVRGYDVQVLVPAGAYAILYSFDGSAVRTRVFVALGTALALVLLWRFLVRRGFDVRLSFALRAQGRRFWRLRTKFLLAIVAVNLVTAAIVFFSLSSLQTREQTQKIERESLLFGQFSTIQVVSDFTNFFYFYYLDRFLPEIKKIIASNENLLRIRIVSVRTSAVLFDSELASFVPVGATSAPGTGGGDAARAEFSPEIGEQLRARDIALERQAPVAGGDPRLLVVSTYRNENQEALFQVEYLFSYATLARSIHAIREQVLIDLIPSIALGLLIAAIFAQLLIRPIRRLVAALQKVTEGNYDVSVETTSGDEIGDLVHAFNAMTGELRKKKELRKYLSDSTYRQIMQAPDTPEGLKLGGSRVEATVLFCDIRDFVGHCENLDAEEVTTMLNEYFSEMVEVVYKNGGEVDKFIGDALLAVFYSAEEVKTIRQPEGQSRAAPSSVATALQSIYCALEMRERLQDFNKRRQSLNKSVIDIGVGISHGEIISGPIGSKDRMDFTVIGDVVNVASRIEKLSKGGRHTRIVFSNAVEEKVRSLLDYEKMPDTQVRGREGEIDIYELIGIRDLGALLANLESGDLHLKRRSIELLGESRNVEALPHVIAALRDARTTDELMRLYAAVALGKLAPKDHPEALAALFGQLRYEASEKTASALIATIGKICTTERILELGPFLDSPNERIVANTIEAMGQVRSAACSDLIIPKLSSRNNRVKANAAMALFAAGHLEVIDSLKPMLMHSDYLMRSSAAFAIGELTLIASQDAVIDRWKSDPRGVKMVLGELQECVPMLVSLLRDPEPIVKRQAVVALGKIRDRSSVLPLIDMIQPGIEAHGIDSKDLVRDISSALRAIGSHRLVRDVITKLSQ